MVQPRYELSFQILRKRNHLVGFPLGNGPNLIIDVAVPFASAEIQEIDVATFEADRKGKALDRALVLVLSLGPVPGGTWEIASKQGIPKP